MAIENGGTVFVVTDNKRFRSVFEFGDKADLQRYIESRGGNGITATPYNAPISANEATIQESD